MTINGFREKGILSWNTNLSTGLVCSTCTIPDSTVKWNESLLSLDRTTRQVLGSLNLMAKSWTVATNLKIPQILKIHQNALGNIGILGFVKLCEHWILRMDLLLQHGEELDCDNSWGHNDSICPFQWMEFYMKSQNWFHQHHIMVLHSTSTRLQCPLENPCDWSWSGSICPNWFCGGFEAFWINWNQSCSMHAANWTLSSTKRNLLQKTCLMTDAIDGTSDRLCHWWMGGMPPCQAEVGVRVQLASSGLGLVSRKNGNSLLQI